MKGWIKALSVPLITALVLTGCGSGASTKKADRGEKKTSLQKSGNDTVLRVSGAEEDTELLKQVMENFKKDNPKFIHKQEMQSTRSTSLLLSSRLYCRSWSYTKSAITARGLYRRSGIAPCPEEFLVFVFRLC